MSKHKVLAFLALALALSATGTAGAQAGRCTRETLAVKGVPVTISYCVSSETSAASGHDLPVAVTENYSTSRGSFSQQSTLQFIAGESVSRVIEDVALAKLGLEGTLHLTLVYRGGLVRIESALLTPGAITIK
jgi:hypothetical protein